MLSSYKVTQYRPSLLGYSVLETITELYQGGAEMTASSVAPPAGLEPADIKLCMITVSNFLQSTAARLVYPVFY